MKGGRPSLAVILGLHSHAVVGYTLGARMPATLPPGAHQQVEGQDAILLLQAFCTQAVGQSNKSSEPHKDGE